MAYIYIYRRITYLCIYINEYILYVCINIFSIHMYIYMYAYYFTNLDRFVKLCLGHLRWGHKKDGARRPCSSFYPYNGRADNMEIDFWARCDQPKQLVNGQLNRIVVQRPVGVWRFYMANGMKKYGNLLVLTIWDGTMLEKIAEICWFGWFDTEKWTNMA